jgi:aspartate/glutamate/glutamine transport system ATP-binding protein
VTVPIILGRGLVKRFGRLEVLRGVDLRVDEGEVVVVLGPSGSGKSTLLRCLNRLETLDGGELEVVGIAVHDRRADVNRLRRQVGMVFQQFNLFPHLTVLDNLTLAPRQVLGLNGAEAEARARALLERAAFQRKPRPTPPSSAVVSSSASPSPAASRWSHASCSSTSPPRPSTPR